MTSGQIHRRDDESQFLITGGGSTTKVSTEELEERGAALRAVDDVLTDVAYSAGKLARPGSDAYRYAPTYARTLSTQISTLIRQLAGTNQLVQDTAGELGTAIDAYRNAESRVVGIWNFFSFITIGFIPKFHDLAFGFGGGLNTVLGMLPNPLAPFGSRTPADWIAWPLRLVGWGTRPKDPIAVKPVTGYQDVPRTVPVGTHGAARSIKDHQPENNSRVPESAITITTIEKPDGTISHLVSIPGTQAVHPFDSPDNVIDYEGIFHNLTGSRSDLTEGIKEAMRLHGISEDEPVVLAGHSQGGMAAVQLLSDESFLSEFDVRGAVTFGSPLGTMTTDPRRPVLALEHEDDFWANAEGATNAVHENLVTVRSLTPDMKNPMEAHSMDTYDTESAKLDSMVDTSIQVDTTREEFAPVLGLTAGTATSSAYQILRTPPNPTTQCYPPLPQGVFSHPPQRGFGPATPSPLVPNPLGPGQPGPGMSSPGAPPGVLGTVPPLLPPPPAPNYRLK